MNFTSPVKQSDASPKLGAVQSSLSQELAKGKLQILDQCPDTPCGITKGFGTERTKMQQLLERAALSV